jgi:hypothetical protein
LHTARLASFFLLVPSAEIHSRWPFPKEAPPARALSRTHLQENDLSASS